MTLNIPAIKIKRVYEDVLEDDGYRILVDRLWPRGISKNRIKIDEWNKAITPSNELRIWFDHQPDKWEIFQKEYLMELKANPEIDKFINTHWQYAVMTLIFAAKNKSLTHALVLQNFLIRKFKGK